MSDVKRWKETESWGFTEGDCMAVMRECNDGEYVLYSDYARLKAEVERVEPELEQRCRELNLSLAHQAVQLRQIEELKAEVERLRKAANNYINVCDKYAMFRCDEERLMARAVALELMNAAKEGKPSV